MTKPPSGRRGPYAKTARRRQEILRTAIEVFAEYGFHGSSLREIAGRVGMSETGLTHHFGGKAALLAAVIEERDAADAVPMGGLRDLRDLVAKNTDRPGIVALFTLLSAEATAPAHPAHDFFTQRYVRVRGELAEQIRDAQRDGHIRADVEPDLLAQVIAAVLDGLQVQWLYDRDADMLRAFDAVMRVLSVPGGAQAETGCGGTEHPPTLPGRAPQ